MAIKEAVTDSIKPVYQASIFLVLLGLLITLIAPEVSLRSRGANSRKTTVKAKKPVRAKSHDEAAPRSSNSTGGSDVFDLPKGRLLYGGHSTAVSAVQQAREVETLKPPGVNALP